MNSLRVEGAKAIPGGQGYFLSAQSDGRLVLSADKVMVDERDGVCRRKIGVSLLSGCGVKCIYCFTNRFADWRPLTREEIIEQVDYLAQNGVHADRTGIQQTKISFKQMGDPLLNPDNALSAIVDLHLRYPQAQFVVSTSAPRCNNSFFRRLGTLALNGIPIRLQFSCHTTDDSQRRVLSPHLTMMSMREIAEVVNAWPGDPVTLNFVLLDGFAFDPQVLKSLFQPDKVFIKLNHLDDNTFIRCADLHGVSPQKVASCRRELELLGLAHADRQNKHQT